MMRRFGNALVFSLLSSALTSTLRLATLIIVLHVSTTSVDAQLVTNDFIANFQFEPKKLFPNQVGNDNDGTVFFKSKALFGETTSSGYSDVIGALESSHSQADVEVTFNRCVDKARRGSGVKFAADGSFFLRSGEVAKRLGGAQDFTMTAWVSFTQPVNPTTHEQPQSISPLLDVLKEGQTNPEPDETLMDIALRGTEQTSPPAPSAGNYGFPYTRNGAANTWMDVAMQEVASLTGQTDIEADTDGGGWLFLSVRRDGAANEITVEVKGLAGGRKTEAMFDAATPRRVVDKSADDGSAELPAVLEPDQAAAYLFSHSKNAAVSPTQQTDTGFVGMVSSIRMYARLLSDAELDAVAAEDWECNAAEEPENTDVHGAFSPTKSTLSFCVSSSSSAADASGGDDGGSSIGTTRAGHPTLCRLSVRNTEGHPWGTRTEACQFALTFSTCNADDLLDSDGGGGGGGSSDPSKISVMLMNATYAEERGEYEFVFFPTAAGSVTLTPSKGLVAIVPSPDGAITRQEITTATLTVLPAAADPTLSTSQCRYELSPEHSKKLTSCEVTTRDSFGNIIKVCQLSEDAASGALGGTCGGA